MQNSFFLSIHLKLKRQIRSYTPVVLSKTLSNSRQKLAKCIPVFRPKPRKKTYPLGQHILPAYIREYPSPPPPPPSVCATKYTHCFSPNRKSDMSGCHIIICSNTGIHFHKIQLLKHREFTLGDSDMILIIMTSLLNIEIRKGNVILIAHEQGKAS